MSAAAATPTAAQRSALKRAARRASGCLCPVTVYGQAEELLIDALVRKGWAAYSGKDVPLITDAGRAVAAGRFA